MTQTSPTNNLKALQESFLDALQYPLQTNVSLSATLKSNSRMQALDCLAIYQRSYYARLLNCMKEQFPALCYSLGEELFNDFSKEYLKTCKPSSYTLYDLGKRFPNFLNDTQPTYHDDRPQEPWVKFMIDLASFEYLVFSLFDAKGNEKDLFASVDTSDSQLKLQKCFALASYDFDVASYYHAVRKNEKPALPSIKKTRLALVRKDYLTHTMLLSEPHYHFLSMMQSGKSVESALYDVASFYNLPEDQVKGSWSDANGVRARWINSGFFLST